MVAFRISLHNFFSTVIAIGAVYPSEIILTLYQTTLCRDPDVMILHGNEHLISHISIYVSLFHPPFCSPSLKKKRSPILVIAWYISWTLLRTSRNEVVSRRIFTGIAWVRSQCRSGDGQTGNGALPPNTKFTRLSQFHQCSIRLSSREWIKDTWGNAFPPTHTNTHNLAPPR